MGYLGKENTLIKRDEAGKLLPVDVVLELLPDKPTVKLIPMTKGKLSELMTFPDKEDSIVREHIFEPSYTEEEFKVIKPQIYGAIKMALFSLSTDASQKEMQDSSVKAILEDSKKKLSSLKED